ncbi:MULTISPECIES: secretin N-terminal domain-containing protein [Pseudanabaena]|uniref:secretin N-terminal domain-containing protein n=1 Tax=Pseudanabaena TaxID=1152 RepID=UPI0024793C3E|nr:MULTISPECIES: secretin N-terminal domain-containing protein [Pseudanabaena]MEA5487027.1 secretin N-terminal domain-containing protein [Pseudanabaena sp. CCNP1317]WGS71762.1 AMIN domain-containing protein [Pseudanabaena galeata CCNP1313]
MNAKLNDRLNANLNGKSLACWFLIAATCPQVLAISPSHAQNATQSPISANQTDVVAVASRITDINADVAGDRLNLTLNFASSDRPQVTYTKQGKAWVALLNGAQLQLGNGNASYAKANPAPGITAIEATQYAANKVQIRVTTNNPELLKDLIKRQDTADSLVFSLEMQPSVAQASTISAANSSEAGVINNSQNASNSDRVLIAQNTTSSSVGQPLFEPKVTITNPDGKTRVAQSTAPNRPLPPVANPVTPQLPGRVPGVVPPFRQIRTPPVGDIATTSSKLRADIIELGTAERVPRITLRDAPAIEVLTLIGRVAGLSVVSAEAPVEPGAAAAPAATTGGTTGLKQPVSLSIENETAQDVFNNVLRITGLEANRIGQTIFVATKLPVTLKNLVSKSYRLNQITTGEASAYLIGLGASRVVSRQRPIPGVQTATIGTAAQAIINVTTEAVPTLETVSITPESGATPLLKGLQVIAEERSNSITLVGSPKQVEYAEAQLARLDLRKRQVTVNVRVVEVAINNGQTVGGGFTTTDGNPTITQGLSIDSTNTLGISLSSNNPITLPTAFIASLTASIRNGSAKVITDPNLTVQEGETATIALTDQVINNITSTVTAATTPGTAATTTTTATFAQVGLTLAIQIERIDDNGFINLSVSPRISTPLNAVPLTSSAGTNFVVPISERVLNSGRIRLRDAQTLVLSGVIRDSDSESVQKVPILGDIPIIGALFRRTVSSNSRSEVIIIVTPRIIDDSQDATWGYTYQPGPETQKVMDSNQRKVQ